MEGKKPEGDWGVVRVETEKYWVWKDEQSNQKSIERNCWTLYFYYITGRKNRITSFQRKQFDGEEKTSKLSALPLIDKHLI